MIYERFLVTLLVIAMGGVTASHLDHHHHMDDHDAIEQGYAQALIVLYRSLYDKLVTNPPGDEHEAQANFERGVTQARKARTLALESLQKAR
jgi:predicted glycoside hydrolase/deacetylase ChbG (UPF0249 family)